MTQIQGNSITKKVSEPTFSGFMSAPQTNEMLTRVLSVNDISRFKTAIVSAVSVNPELPKCDFASILSAAMVGESLKLSPSPQLGQYYMIPFAKKGENKKHATFVLGAKGYKQLAMRTGQYKDIDVIEIRSGEYLGKDKETGKPLFSFIEDDDERETLPIIGYMAYFELLNGFKKRIYWSYAKMIKHADEHSPAFSEAVYRKILNGEIPKSELWKYSSFWYEDFNEMAFKTMIRQIISKWGIMSIEFQQAFESDREPIVEQQPTTIEDDFFAGSQTEKTENEPA